MGNLITNVNINCLIKKFCIDKVHANQVSRLAVLLFDITKGILHNLSKKEREKLEIAAFLHDIGHFYGAKKHNKASLNIIMTNKIEGFDETDLLIIANVARYHRGKLPDKNHTNFMNLPDDDARSQVETLSAFLRIADGLDKEHQALIKDLNCELNKDSNTLFIVIKPFSAKYLLDMNLLLKKKILLEKVFGVQVVFRLNEDI